MASTATKTMRRRNAALCCCFIQFLLLVRPVRGTARRSIFYEDSACSLETLRVFYYSASSIDAAGNTTEAPFNVCYARGSTGAITTCNPLDGTTTVQTYVDTECNQQLYTTASESDCVTLEDGGSVDTPGGSGSSSSDCTDTTPSASVEPTVFNFVGTPFNDKFCTERTGEAHVVAGSAFGAGTGECDRSFLSTGRLNALSTCMTDGSVFSQVQRPCLALALGVLQIFAATDATCAGEMLYESVMFSASGSGSSAHVGGVCTLGVFSDRYEYYRLTSCTTDPVSDKVSAPTTAPVPTPAPKPITLTPKPSGGSDLSYSYGVDSGTRGPDGDDDSDDDGGHDGGDDSDSDSGSDDKDTGRKPDDDSSHHSDDDTDETPSPEDHPSPSPVSSSDDHDDDDHDGKHHKDDDDRDHEDGSSDSGSDDSSSESSDEDDDLDADVAGGGDSDSSDDGGGGLDGDGIGALIFALTVSILICVFSAVLALAGRDSESAKVGPK